MSCPRDTILGPEPQVSRQSPPAASPNTARMLPPKAPVGARVQVPVRPSFPAKKLWVISGGTAGLLILAVGALLWLRPATPGVDDVAPARGTELDKPDDLGQSKLLSPSVPGRNPKSSEERIASTPTGDVGRHVATGPQVDGAGQPKAAPATASRRLRLLVPAYIYPGGDGRQEWQRLFDAASKAEIVAIANPHSGPGDERKPEYDAIFSKASSLGITIVGYVSTDFGNRPQAEIKNEVDTWIRFYPQIRGIFFDQQPREGRSRCSSPSFATMSSGNSEIPW